MSFVKRLTGLSIVAILFAAALATDGSETSTRKAISTAINTPATAGAVEVTVTEVEYRSGLGNEFFGSKASDAAVYVCVHYSIKNISDKPLPVISFSGPSQPGNLELISPTGTHYDLDLGASASYATELDSNSKILSDLNPGLTVRDADVFEISRDAASKSGWKALIPSDPPVMVPIPAYTGG